MTNAKNFVIAFILVLFVRSADAQKHSLSTMPADEKFTSAKGGFTVGLPKDGVETLINKTDERGVKVLWDLAEGVVTVQFGEYLDDSSLKSDQDLAYFL